jgi:hypothetical protein
MQILVIEGMGWTLSHRVLEVRCLQSDSIEKAREVSSRSSITGNLGPVILFASSRANGKRVFAGCFYRSDRMAEID